ncbi:Protein CBR-STR-230 [Caenorhabditis briggsae]|uniref:Protein CBR-STR-230 n=3 Tax=Caenorhabditis briggsae TaxID=6238 RepID=A8Y3B8_CAEBR|nr:Protein CBR-STR-230 [Caenorhabditis briggsae]CAP39387.2 Protein CBR-STR-230 [Caenorhabditis briggsae]
MWSQILRCTQQTLGTVAFFTNFLLIWLIMMKSPKAMYTYKHIMVFTSVFEIFYAWIDMFVAPELITKRTYWIAETDTTKTWLPLSIVYPLLLAWGGSFGIALASFIVHFMFRYFTIIGNKFLLSQKNFMVYIWLSIPVICGFFYALLTHIFLQQNEIMDTLICTDIESLRNVPKNEMTFSFFTMTIFAIKGYSAIRKFQGTHTNLSSLSKSLQTQLFYSLVIQTAIPTILIHFPSTVILIRSFMGTTEEIYGHIFTISVSLFPVIDPLPSMIIIQPYRKAIKTCFRLSKGQNSTIASSYVGSRTTTF